MRLLLTLLLISFSAYSSSARVTIYATRIAGFNLVNPDEGDHIFSNINEYPENGIAKVDRVPDYPMNWESRILPCVKDVKIWQGEVKDDSSIRILFSLVDQALPLMEEDRLIGNIMVDLTNKNKKLVADWSVPDFYDQPKVDKVRISKPQYLMFGSNSQYMVEFKVEVGK